jgi:ribose-phosphate pyrophosphokinase
MFEVRCNNLIAPVRFLTFPGGEEHVQVTNPCNTRPSEFSVEALLTSSADIMRLLLLTDALRRMSQTPAKSRLSIPYLPYARQDRVANHGESLSVKVMCDLINNMEYDRVYVTDCHSDVGISLLNNVWHTDQKTALTCSDIPHIENYILIAPDAGAAKKIYDVARFFHNTEVIIANKLRDTQTGEITEVSIPVDALGIEGKDLLIVDDICDGGRTFIELAKVLKQENPKSISLYVTHGIFSKGKEIFNGLIDNIYCAHDWTELNETV